jgi:hypothetical protein
MLVVQATEEWKLAVKYQNGSLALELFPTIEDHQATNLTTSWHPATR